MQSLELLERLIQEPRYSRLNKWKKSGLIYVVMHKDHEPAVGWDPEDFSKIQGQILMRQSSKFVTEARRLLGLSN